MKLSFCALAALLVGASSAAAVGVRTVAFSGDRAPGTVDATFFGPQAPVLNDAGRTAFMSAVKLDGMPVSNQAGYWSEGGGNGLELVMCGGQPAPGTLFNFLSTVGFNSAQGLNNDGEILFDAYLVEPGNDSIIGSGLWRGAPTTPLELLAQSDAIAPGTGGVVFKQFANFHLTSTGLAAFGATLDGAGLPEGIWSEAGGNGLQLVASAASQAPGTDPGVHFSDFGATFVNSAGHVAFPSTLEGPGVETFENGFGVWSDAAGNGLALLARSGSPAPGTEAGVNFRGFNTVGINAAGDVAFFASVQGTGVIDILNATGIWIAHGGSSPQLVVRANDPVAGSEGLVVAGFLGQVSINGEGQLAFVAGVRGTGVDTSNNLVVMSDGDSHDYEIIAREGEVPPGVADDARFSDFETPPGINRRGQTAFTATLSGGNVDETNDEGLWATDLDGELHLVVRTGDLFDVDDGPSIVLKTVRSLSFFNGWGNESSVGSGFNDRGQIAFQADFTDFSSGVFVSDLVAALPGDYDFNGIVGADDYTIWRNSLGEEGDGLAADGDGDGKIDQGDYALWKSHFGESTGSGSVSVVPEPGCGLLLLSLAVFVPLRTKRR